MPFISIKLPRDDVSVDLQQIAQKVAEASGLGLQQLNLYVEHYKVTEYVSGTPEPTVAIQIIASRKNPQAMLQQIMLAAADEVKAQLGIQNVGAFIIWIDAEMMLAHGKLR